MKQNGATRNLGVTAVIASVVLGVVAVIALVQTVNEPDPADGSSGPAQVLRSDSHRLDEAPDGRATLVEFLDFECEACGAAYPFIEDLRERYDGELTFVIRYLPLPGHANSRNAAHAVEAAARQGEIEPMYQRMFQTQAEWGESQDSKAALFRSFAEDLGLDLEQYDRDVDSDAVADRVERDFQDASRLGVTGTPSFFLNGERFQPQSDQDFYDSIDAALAD
ncbi:MAG: DsbA family protein [Actinobacteria bacterium]|nr:DsbA family protein [Actinomycetota bacterium]